MCTGILDELKKIIDAQNRRGHASDRSVPNNHDQDNTDYQNYKSLAECDVARDFADAYARQFGKDIIEIEHNSEDPPDCFALLDGKRIGIEVTELVKSEILERIARAWKDRSKKEQQALSQEDILHQQEKNSVDNHTKLEWTKEELLDQLQDRIRKKDENEKLRECANNMRIILVIWTAEPGLSSDTLNIWLSEEVFSSKHVTDIFFLGPYQAKNNTQLRVRNSIESTHGIYPLYCLSIE